MRGREEDIRILREFVLKKMTVRRLGYMRKKLVIK
jgi:hypothetical protein